MSTLLSAAQGYASGGFPVFPVDAKTKRPLTEHGFVDATCDPEIVVDWWYSKYPEAGIGFPTGKIFVIDVDDPSVELPFDIPETLITQTQNGGRHIYLLCPVGYVVRNKQGIIPGVDIRGDGGYVIVPPTPGYTLLSLVDFPDIPVASAEVMRFVTGRVAAPAGGNGSSKHKTVLDMGLAHEGDRVPVLDGLVKMVASDAFKMAVAADPGRLVEMARTYLQGRKYREDQTGSVEPTVMEGFDLVKMEMPEIPWLADGFISRGDSAILAGAPKSGKSLVALELAIAAATGGSFCEFIEFNEAVPAIYIDHENPLEAVIMRMKQMSTPRGYDGGGLRYIHRQKLYLDNASSMHWLLDQPPSLIVLDSLSRMHRGEENSNDSITRLWEEAITPMTSHGHTVVAIHHRRKKSQDEKKQGDDMDPIDLAEMTRGASALGAAVDQMWSLTRSTEDGTSVLVHALARHTEPLAPISIEFGHVEIDGVECWRLIGTDAGVDMEGLILGFLARSGCLVRRTDMLAELGIKNRSTNDSRFRRALKRLKKQGRIREESVPGTGRPKAYSIVG